MTKLELKTSGRQFRRQFVAAIQGNLIRALTELITNSDDSYRRLAWSGQPGFGTILILYKRKKRRLSVVDWAEGMDANDMHRMYPSYGGATSGLYEDKSVRGYFGKGLKDVLFSMQGGTIQSIKEDRVYTARFLWDGVLPTIQIEDESEEATPEARKKLGIPQGNGTRVSFEIPETMKLPRHDSLLKNLSNYYMLRLINASDQRQILLRTRQGKNQIYENHVRYRFPAGEMVLEDTFVLDYQRPFLVDLQVYRAKTPLSQAGIDREGGLLVYDDYASVLDLTLFQFNHEEHASHLFGCLQLHDFHELLKADEYVLTDTRDGLNGNHAFTQALAKAVEARLRPVVERERHIHLRSISGELSQEQHRRLGHSIEQINALLGNLSGVSWALGEETDPGPERPPEGGLEFRPKSIVVSQDSKTAARLRIDTSQVPAGARVELNWLDDRIACHPKTFVVQDEPGRLVAVQKVVISGKQAGERTQVEAHSGGFRANLQVQVVASSFPNPDGGFAFTPDVLRLASNRSRQARLYLDESIAQAGDTLSFCINNPQFEIDPQQVTLQPGDFRNGIARLAVRVKGTGIGERTVLTASTRQHTTTLNMEVVSRTEKVQRGTHLVSGYRFDRSTPSRVRASYDDETGLIWIYLRNPIVERYFGDLPLDVALNTPHCQILLAEIILEQVAWVSRSKMIETGAAMYVSDNHTEEDLVAVRRFMAEYGNKIHSFIADDTIIERAIQHVTHDDISVQAEESMRPGLPPQKSISGRRFTAKLIDRIKNVLQKLIRSVLPLEE